jgi:multisubunit Na+/H+ antiporter MnhB subunit
MADSYDIPTGVRPPWLPTTVSWCAALCAVALVVVGFDGGGVEVPLAGWLAGGVVTVTCAIVHRLVDRRRGQRPGYSRGRLARPATTAAVAVGVLAGLRHAWVLAWFLTQSLHIFGGTA